MRKKFTKKPRGGGMVLPLLFLSAVSFQAQQLYVGDSPAFYLGPDLSFSNSSHFINTIEDAHFWLKAGNPWITSSEYVEGKIMVYGAGTTVVNIGNTQRSTVTITTQVGDEISCVYTKNAPSGNLSAALSDYALSDTEYWTVEKNAGTSTDVAVTGLVADIDATYDGNDMDTTIIVRFNTDTNQWEAYSGSEGFGQFALAADISALSISNEALNSDQLSLYPNPVTENQQLYFKTTKNYTSVEVSFYDVLGKKCAMQSFSDISSGAFQLTKPQLGKGMYFVVFNINKSEQTITKKIIL